MAQQIFKTVIPFVFSKLLDLKGFPFITNIFFADLF